MAGFQEVLGDKFDRFVAKTASYEATDPTIDSQAITLQSSGADVLMTVAIPKFAVQMIRKIYDIGWKPLHIVSYVSTSVASVIEPAGPEKAVGISAAFQKDPTDPTWKDDPGMNEWRTFMQQLLPGVDVTDSNYVYAYGVAMTMVQRQCGDDLSRENIMRQAANLHDLALPTLLPGIKINTSPANYCPIRQLRLERWNGKHWELFGDVMEGSSA